VKPIGPEIPTGPALELFKRAQPAGQALGNAEIRYKLKINTDGSLASLEQTYSGRLAKLRSAWTGAGAAFRTKPGAPVDAAERLIKLRWLLREVRNEAYIADAAVFKRDPENPTIVTIDGDLVDHNARIYIPRIERLRRMIEELAG
jgi:hypothetical protein